MALRNKEAIRVLLLAANPSSTMALRLDQEARDIQEVLERAEVRAEVCHSTAVRPRDLPHKLRTFRPNFVHFSGHGQRKQGILLDNAIGTGSFVSGETLASLFELFRGVKCVFLNSCHSAAQASAIAQHVPYVIGMREAISDRAAIEFSFGFYQAIGDGESISSAFEYGKMAVKLANISAGFDIPVLVSGLNKNSSRVMAGEGAGDPITETGGGEPVESLRQLSELSWREFERFSLRVIEAIYCKESLKITHIPHAREAKDGEAQYILAIGLEDDSKVSFRVWVEVKQRRRRSIGKTDVASHILDVLDKDVSKMVLVTNRTFSNTIYAWLREFSSHTGIQYQLIDGPTLLDYAHALFSSSYPIEPATPLSLRDLGSDTQHEVFLTSWFALSSADRHPQASPKAPITVRPDRPFFLVVEAKFSDQLQPCEVTIEAKPSADQNLTLYPWPPQSPPKAYLARAGEQIRQSFLIWPGVPTGQVVENVTITINSEHPIKVHQSFLNSVKLPNFALANTKLPCQDRIVESIKSKINHWLACKEFFFTLLVSPPGLGKSRVIARVREYFHVAKVMEVFLDCESVNTDLDFMQSLCKTLLPLPPTLLDRDLIEPLTQWFIQIGVSRDTATQIAQDLCGEVQESSQLASGYRVEIVSAVLAYASNAQPLVIIMEDLHKASPSLLSLLATLTSQMSASGTSDIALIASTRPFYSGTPNLRTEWLAALSSISARESCVVFELNPPAQREARELLQESVIGLEDHQADVILEAVGTAPYSLRESVLFLLARESLVFSEFDGHGALVVADPTRLRFALSSDQLSRATELRLKLLLDNQPDWLHLLLLGGAVYGRRFPISSLLDALKINDDIALNYALDVCSSWSILVMSPTGAEWLEFDHDLVRESILLIGPARTKVTVARALLETLGATVEAQIQCRLAYQAGFAELCLAATERSKGQAKVEGRVADIVELNQIAIQVLDPEVAAGMLVELLKTGQQNLIDPAFRSSPPPKLDTLSRDQRLRAVLRLLLENIKHLSTVGSGSSSATEAAITEARLIAESLGENDSIPQLMYLEGRMWFERDVLEKSYDLHEMAESLFLRQGCYRNSARAENLVRQAICLRKSGRIEESIATLMTAARQRPSGDWLLLNKVRNNLGAAHLHTNWAWVRYHWEKQIRQADRRGLLSRKVHGLASLSFIDLFENKLEEGVEKAKEALELAENLRLDNQIVRLCLNLSIYLILTNDYLRSKAYLLRAEQLALRHSIGRRLWRVTANLATVDELLGSREGTFAKDLQFIRQMRESFLKVKLHGREILPLVNIVLRTRRASEYDSLLEDVPTRCLEVAECYSTWTLACRQDKLPGLLGNYCAQTPAGPRFLLSE